MKKLFQVFILMFMITGAFMFTGGREVAAATDVYDGFTVYSYTASDTTHTLPADISSKINEFIIYVNGNLIYNLGVLDPEWNLYPNLDSDLSIEDDASVDMITFQTHETGSFVYGVISNSNMLEVTFFHIEDPSLVNVWSFDASTETATHDIDTLIEDNTYLFVKGKIINDDLDWIISFNDFNLLNLESLSLGDTISFNLDGAYYDNLLIDLTIIEVIVEIPIEYTITFNPNGGTAVDPIVVTEGAMLGETIWTPSTVTTKEGYTFDDWYKNAGLTIPVTEVDTVTSDLTLYANWTLNVVNHTVTFNTNGGSYVAPAVVESGNPVTRPTDPQKVGYIFGGWYSELFLINLYDFQDTVDDNMTLYAQWTLAEEEIEEKQDFVDWVSDNPFIVILFLCFLAIIIPRK